MSQNQPHDEETESQEPEAPGVWLFGMLADMGLMGPWVEEEKTPEEDDGQGKS